jgi:hypothetical protein
VTGEAVRPFRERAQDGRSDPVDRPGGEEARLEHRVGPQVHDHRHVRGAEEDPGHHAGRPPARAASRPAPDPTLKAATPPSEPIPRAVRTTRVEPRIALLCRSPSVVFDVRQPICASPVPTRWIPWDWSSAPPHAPQVTFPELPNPPARLPKPSTAYQAIDALCSSTKAWGAKASTQHSAPDLSARGAVVRAVTRCPRPDRRAR